MSTEAKKKDLDIASHADVLWGSSRAPLRTSAWEANLDRKAICYKPCNAPCYAKVQNTKWVASFQI